MLGSRWLIVSAALFVLLGGMIRTPISATCRVEGSGTPPDVALASAACDRAVERFTLLFGKSPPPVAVEVSDTLRVFVIETEASEWKIRWPDSARLRDFLAATTPDLDGLDEAVSLQWSAVLPHELGHLMLIAETDARRPSGSAARRLPDWLHEGIAVWMEPPAYRHSEYGILRALRPFVPQVDDITSLSISSPDERGEAGSTIHRTFYPCASEEACGGRPHWSRIFTVTTRTFPDGTVTVDTIFHEQAPPPPSPVGANFYAYSATLVRYLFDRGGASALDALLDRYARSSDNSEVSLARLPGLPTNAPRLEADWEEWFRRWVLAE